MVSRKEKLRVIDRAIETLRVDGWCQDEFLCDNGSVCAMGAIGYRDHSETPFARQLVALELEDMLKADLAIPTFSNLADWNDEYGRTKRQVIGAFQRLRSKIVKLMEKG